MKLKMRFCDINFGAFWSKKLGSKWQGKSDNFHESCGDIDPGIFRV